MECLKCKNEIGEGLFCSEKCGDEYVNEHFQWSKTITDPNQKGYQLQCKGCGQTLKNAPNYEVSDEIVKELSNHLPNCSKQKAYSGSRCCICKKPGNDLNYQKWIAEGGYSAFCSKVCEDDWINKYGESDSIKDHYKDRKTKINLGPDYNTLKTTQQQGRQKTQASWSNKKNISFVCIHCKALFAYDKSIESYLEARNRAKNQITNHLRSCSFKESSKSQFQEWWTGIRSSKTRIIKTCETCWGKVLWDKSITDAKQARQQVLSDFKYHQDHECHLIPTQRTIAIYHSPNQGGNQHAPLDNTLIDDGIYSQDEETSNTLNWKPLVIGGIVVVGLALIGLVIYFFTRNKEHDKSK